ncbi:MAG: hydroxymyristoyl-ACP dehydratase [Steroidobacteraceae bacterium]
MPAAPSRTLCVDNTHPSLPGHFPGMPVVPGVVLLSQVLADLRVQFPAVQVTGIRKLKFLRMLLPEQPFTVEFEPADATSMRLKCWQDGAVLAEGRLSVRTQANEASQRSGLHV